MAVDVKILLRRHHACRDGHLRGKMKDRARSSGCFAQGLVIPHIGHNQADPVGIALCQALQIILYSRRSEEHTSELQSLMRISYAVFCLQKKREQASRYEQRTT